MSGISGPKNTTDSLIFAVDAADKSSYVGSGSNNWYDLINPTITGSNSGSLFYSLGGGSMYFSGSGSGNSAILQYYQFDPNSYYPLINNMTFDTWVYISQSVNASNYFISIASVNFNFLYSQSTRKFGIQNQYDLIGGGNSIRTISTNLSYPSQSWYNVVTKTQYDGFSTTQSIYVNGDLSVTTSILSGSQSIGLGDYLYLGTRADGGSFNIPFNGYISDFKIYKRTLSDEEIRLNYVTQKYRYGL